MKKLLLKWSFRLVCTLIIALISNYLFNEKISFVDFIMLNLLLALLIDETKY